MTIAIYRSENDIHIDIKLLTPLSLQRHIPIAMKKIKMKTGYFKSNPEIPNKGGIYFLFKNLDLVYVGKRQSVRDGIYSHVVEGAKDFNSAAYTLEEKERIRVLKEFLYVMLYKPKYNKTERFVTGPLFNDNDGNDPYFKEG